MGYNKWEKKEKEFLDTIDLIPLLRSGRDIEAIMDEIEDSYKDEYIDEEFIFNNMSPLDFKQYLKHRYPNIHINEFIKYYIY